MSTSKVDATTPKSLGIGGNTSAVVSSDFATATSGVATVADDDDDDDLESPLVIDERSVREVVINEDEFLYPPILRPVRSFEQKLKVGRVNVGGVHLNTAFAAFADSDLWSGRRGSELMEQKEWLKRHHTNIATLDDIDPDTGRMEDRRSEWTIEKRTRQAREREERERRRQENLPLKVSSTDNDDAVGEENTKVSSSKKVLRKVLIRNRCRSANTNKVYRPGGDRIVDTYIGTFRSTLKETSKLMENIILEPKTDGSRCQTWKERADSAAEYPSQAVDFAETEYIDINVDTTLVQAEDHKQINQIWAAGLNKAVAEANRAARLSGIRIDATILKGWVADTDVNMDSNKSSEESVDSIVSSVSQMSVSPPNTTVDVAHTGDAEGKTVTTTAAVEATFGASDGGSILPEANIAGSAAKPVAAVVVGDHVVVDHDVIVDDNIPTGIKRWNRALFGPMPAPSMNINPVNDGNADNNIGEPNRAVEDADVPDRVIAGPIEPAEDDVADAAAGLAAQEKEELDDLARRHSDEVVAAVKADQVRLNHVEVRRLEFFANVVYRLDRYRTTSQPDQVLIDQMTLG